MSSCFCSFLGCFTFSSLVSQQYHHLCNQCLCFQLIECPVPYRDAKLKWYFLTSNLLNKEGIAMYSRGTWLPGIFAPTAESPKCVSTEGRVRSSFGDLIPTFLKCPIFTCCCSILAFVLLLELLQYFKAYPFFLV